MASSGRDQSITPEATLAVFDQLGYRDTPLTTLEVTSELECVQHSVVANLCELENRGVLQSKTLAGGTRIWWRSTNTETADSVGIDPFDFSAAENSEKILSTLVEQNLFGIYVVQNRRFQYVNKRLADIFGETPAAMIGESPLEWIAEDDHDRVLENLRKRESGEVESLQFTVTGNRRDGEQIEYEVHGGRIELNGEPAVMGALIDVTERKSRENVLREIYEVTSDKTLPFEEKVSVLLDIGQSVLGTEYGALSNVVGDDYFFEIVHDPDNEPQSGDGVALRDTNSERVVVTEETVVLSDIAAEAPELTDRAGFTAQGISCYIGTPVVIDDEVYGTFCFYDREARSEPFSDWDVTLVELMGNWVSYEQDRERRELTLMKQRNRLDDFANMVSHDLRNPLNVAQGRLELAMTEQENEHLDAVATAHERMGELIDDMLTLAQSGSDVSNPECLPVKQTIMSAWQTAGNQSAVIGVEQGLGWVQGDHSLIQQLFENLFRNTLDHAGTSAEIQVGRLAGANGIFVEDDGPGIESGQHETIFQDGFSTREDGTGLGLRIVQEIVDAHGWTITVTEAPNGGARFELSGLELLDQNHSNHDDLG